MASLELDNIYSRFYLRIKDYEIVGLEEKIVKEMMNGYIRSTLAKPMVRRVFQYISIDEDFGEVEFELRDPWDEDSDSDFVGEMLALGMVCEWVSPRYHSTLLTSQFFSNSEQKYYSQANQLTEMKSMYEKAQSDLKKLIRDRGYSTSVIFGVETT